MVEYFNGGEELMNYTDLVNIFKSRNEYGSKMWTFDNINAHMKLIDHPWEFKVIWGNRKETWEPMHTIT